LAYLVEACIEIWRFFLNFGDLWLLKISEKHNGVSIGTFNFYYIFLVIIFFCVVAKSGQEDLVRFGLPSLENVGKSGDFSLYFG
jgi:hypothetical protein